MSSPGIIGNMTSTEIVSAIDSEISRLQQVRSLLSDAENIGAATKPGRGRPKDSKKGPKAVEPKKREMSEEGKARIAAAQKKRWAATKRAKQ